MGFHPKLQGRDVMAPAGATLPEGVAGSQGEARHEPESQTHAQTRGYCLWWPPLRLAGRMGGGEMGQCGFSACSAMGSGRASLYLNLRGIPSVFVGQELEDRARHKQQEGLGLVVLRLGLFDARGRHRESSATRPPTPFSSRSPPKCWEPTTGCERKFNVWCSVPEAGLMMVFSLRRFITAGFTIAHP